MDAKQIFGGIILLIMAYLLLKNAKNTNTVVAGFSNLFTNNIQALQGNTPSAVNGATIPASVIQV